MCGAIKRDGGRCRHYAGFRTDHPRVGACFLHGGNAPSHKKAAAVAEAREQMAALGAPLPEDTRPTQLLLWLTRVVGGHVQALLADPEAADLSTEVGRAKFRLTMEQIDRASRLAKQASEANAEQVEANVKQAEAEAMARLVRKAAEHAGLTGDRFTALGVGLRLAVAEAQGDTEAAERTTAALAQLREQIADDDRRRIEREAQRLTGLVPAAEIAPGEDTGWMAPPEPAEPEPAAEPEWTPEPEPSPAEPPGRPRRPPEEPTRTNYKTDAPPGDDPLFGPF